MFYDVSQEGEKLRINFASLRVEFFFLLSHRAFFSDKLDAPSKSIDIKATTQFLLKLSGLINLIIHNVFDNKHPPLFRKLPHALMKTAHSVNNC